MGGVPLPLNMSLFGSTGRSSVGAGVDPLAPALRPIGVAALACAEVEGGQGQMDGWDRSGRCFRDHPTAGDELLFVQNGTFLFRVEI